MNNKQGQTTRRRSALAAGVAPGGIVAVTPALASAQQAPVQPFLADYFAAQDRALLPSTSDVSATLSSLYASGRTAAVLRNYQMDTAVGFHKWVAMHGDRYRAIRTSYNVRSLQQSGNT